MSDTTSKYTEYAITLAKKYGIFIRNLYEKDTLNKILEGLEE